jgi:hypothetical protein
MLLQGWRGQEHVLSAIFSPEIRRPWARHNRGYAWLFLELLTFAFALLKINICRVAREHPQ